MIREIKLLEDIIKNQMKEQEVQNELEKDKD